MPYSSIVQGLVWKHERFWMYFTLHYTRKHKSYSYSRCERLSVQFTDYFLNTVCSKWLPTISTHSPRCLARSSMTLRSKSSLISLSMISSLIYLAPWWSEEDFLGIHIENLAPTNQGNKVAMAHLKPGDKFSWKPPCVWAVVSSSWNHMLSLLSSWFISGHKFSSILM